jgi:hypothetical protein
MCAEENFGKFFRKIGRKIKLPRCIGYSGHLHASENVQCKKFGTIVLP